MNKSLIILLLSALLCSACSKNQHKPACATQVCSAIFMMIGIHFTDKAGTPISVENFEVFDLSTNQQLKPGLPNINTTTGYYIVANDSQLKDFSTDGDNIRVSATNPASGQTKTVTLKISGGCNCHVSRISGPETVAFD
jgi:hypothetical protein